MERTFPEFPKRLFSGTHQRPKTASYGANVAWTQIGSEIILNSMAMLRFSILSLCLVAGCNGRVPAETGSDDANGDGSKQDVPDADCWEVIENSPDYCGIEDTEFPWGDGFHIFTGLIPEQADGTCKACPTEEVNQMVLDEIAKTQCDKPIDKLEPLCIKPTSAVADTCVYWAYYWSECDTEPPPPGG